MMAEGEFVAPELLGGGIQDAAPQTRAQRAVGRARLGLLRDHGVGVLAKQVELDALPFKPVLQAGRVVARLDLIEVDGDQAPVVKGEQ